jgi:hypothetical protein
MTSKVVSIPTDCAYKCQAHGKVYIHSWSCKGCCAAIAAKSVHWNAWGAVILFGVDCTCTALSQCLISVGAHPTAYIPHSSTDLPIQNKPAHMNRTLIVVACLALLCGAATAQVALCDKNKMPQAVAQGRVVEKKMEGDRTSELWRVQRCCVSHCYSRHRKRCMYAKNELWHAGAVRIETLAALTCYCHLCYCHLLLPACVQRSSWAGWAPSTVPALDAWTPLCESLTASRHACAVGSCRRRAVLCLDAFRPLSSYQLALCAGLLL